MNREPGMHEKPNVLFILADQLRYDLFSCRQNPYIDTPNIDKLADEGALFANAVCSSPLCGPSRAAILTGRYSKGNYIICNREPDQEGPWLGELQTYDEILTKNDYTCTWHGKWHNGRGHQDCYSKDSFNFGHNINSYHNYLRKKYPLPRGNSLKTDRYTGWPYQPWEVDDVMSQAAERGFHMPHNNEAGIIDIDSDDSLTAWTVKQSIDFLNAGPQLPFSLTCSILHPHAPLITTIKYADLYRDINFSLPPNIGALARDDSPIPGSGFNHSNFQEFSRLYYALVKELDDWVGELLKALDRNNLTSNTLVIFTADHGELLGSHGTLSKKEFFEECLRVPLLMRLPDDIPAGSILNGPASGVDLAPTILDYCDIEIDGSMDGCSLREQIKGEKVDNHFVFSELKDKICWRSNTWKVVFKKKKCVQLFNLQTDKYEKRNLAFEIDNNKEAQKIVHSFDMILPFT